MAAVEHKQTETAEAWLCLKREGFARVVHDTETCSASL